MNWTIEQVMALAPDDSSAKAGKGLASASNWVSMGRKDTSALWGECKGSGSNPYQVQIDLSEPAFKCSCPSRKFPCKHGLGLFLMYAKSVDSIPAAAEMPAWVSEWMDKRHEKAEKKEAAASAEKTPEELARAAADQVKRAASRDKKVAQGLQDLDLWLRDIVRQGFGSLATRPLKFWDDMAARMVDAQAPGVARVLRDMGGIASSGEGWQDSLLERFGLLYLLIEGYGRLSSLPEGTQNDIREAVGYNVRQEELLAQPGISDLWYVAGSRISEDLQLRVQRAYLIGQRTGKSALILNFAPLASPAAMQQLDAGLVTGVAFEAELVYFPSASPLRAVLKERQIMSAALPTEAGFGGFGDMLSSFADSLSANPWREEFPALLRGVVPRNEAERWALEDSRGNRIPIASGFDGGWRMLALSGGTPLPAVFGEWNGKRLLPLSTFAHNGVVTAFS